MSMAKHLVKLFNDNKSSWTKAECLAMLLRAFNDTKINGVIQSVFTQADYDWVVTQLDEIYP